MSAKLTKRHLYTVIIVQIVSILLYFTDGIKLDYFKYQNLI